MYDALLETVFAPKVTVTTPEVAEAEGDVKQTICARVAEVTAQFKPATETAMDEIVVGKPLPATVRLWPPPSDPDDGEMLDTAATYVIVVTEAAVANPYPLMCTLMA